LHSNTRFVFHLCSIIKFAGDAMLVLWRNKRKPPVSLDEGAAAVPAGKPKRPRKDLQQIFGEGDVPLPFLVLRACSCVLGLLAQYGSHQIPDFTDVRLTLHCGIGAGDIRGLFVGGVDGLWEFFVAGDPIRQMSDAGEEATSGELVISAEALALVDSWVVGKRLSSGNFRITDLNESVLVFKAVVPNITSQQEAALIGFIPLVVQRRLDAGMAASWLAEYRKVHIMFVALPEVPFLLVWGLFGIWRIPNSLSMISVKLTRLMFDSL
jgi:class 3 adenylate cyclase